MWHELEKLMQNMKSESSRPAVRHLTTDLVDLLAGLEVPSRGLPQYVAHMVVTITMKVVDAKCMIEYSRKYGESG